MSNKEILTELLRMGLLEIRLLSSECNSDTCHQIYALSNILHNLPNALDNADVFDMVLLKKLLQEYENKYAAINLNLSKVLNETTFS